MSDRRIGLAQGTALYVGAILGAGVLALPSLAAQIAGPASVLAWLALVALCVPVAATFTALGTRYPDGGGVATFVKQAFGPQASAAVGWWFYFALPIGATAVAYVGGQYVAHAFGAGDDVAYLVAAVIVLIGLTTNAIGLHVSGGVQLLLISVLALLMVVTVLAALPKADPGNLAPFLPNGWAAVGRAASVLFFTFAGWEAVTHLSGDFADPKRDLPKVTAWTLVVVGVLYVGLALTCVLVLGPRLAASSVPITLLLEEGLGSGAAMLTGVLAFLLTTGVMNAYLAGGARLGAALARDGALPLPLARGGAAGETPRRSLAVLGGVTVVVATGALAAGMDLGNLMLAASACFMAVYVAGLAAGAKLLPTGSAVWIGSLVACAVMAVVLVFSGWFLLLPVALALGSLAFRRYAKPKTPVAA
ncbi:amino acid permease [Saccharopolyspora gloriosae]|uniref:Amino acid efflux transporter n=1 Tax=Saccharopolyspora gloriosae TaxID=455344 RepID=A0A840NIS1_9PSEU|nr:amino acid efflux transporter [Saccharopolyspora gloriosae]